MRHTEKSFKLVLSQLRQLSKDNGTFEDHRVNQELKGLTTSWTNRFDDAKLFEKTGLATGVTLHWLTTCNN